MQRYTATILAPDRSHTVRVDLTATDTEDAKRQAIDKGRALFRRDFTFSVRAA